MGGAAARAGSPAASERVRAASRAASGAVSRAAGTAAAQVLRVVQAATAVVWVALEVAWVISRAEVPTAAAVKVVGQGQGFERFCTHGSASRLRGMERGVISHKLPES